MQTLPLIQYSYFEVVLKRIFDILVAEEENQEAQAILLDLNPADYSWRNNLEEFLHIDSDTELSIPLVNIWFSNSTYQGSNNRTTQGNQAVYNIDIYVKSDSVAEDEEESVTATDGMKIASSTINRVIRQIFATLMSPKYFELGFPRTVDGKLTKFIDKRYFVATTKFQPGNATVSVDNVIAARMEFKVELMENIYDLTGQPLTSILTNINAPKGEDEPGVLTEYDGE